LTLQQKVQKANDAYDEARLERAEELFLKITKEKPKLQQA